jgi:hypothetical protein
MRMPHIAICGLSDSTIFSLIIGTGLEKNVNEYKMQRLSEKFLIL